MRFDRRLKIGSTSPMSLATKGVWRGFQVSLNTFTDSRFRDTFTRSFFCAGLVQAPSVDEVAPLGQATIATRRLRGGKFRPTPTPYFSFDSLRAKLAKTCQNLPSVHIITNNT